MKSILLILTLSLTINAFAASFECNKKSTQIEKTICYDHTLSSLDNRLNNYFDIIKRSLQQIQQKAFISEQIAWIKERDKTCNIEHNKSRSNCLKGKYTKRLLFLRNKYENTLFNFPQEAEINKVCFELAKDPKDYIKRFELKPNKFDINNDGVNETIKCEVQGTMKVPYCEYLNDKGKTIEISEITPRECCSYGLMFLSVDGKVYKIVGDDGMKHLNYLLYLAPANEEYILCEFQNKNIEKWTYNANIKDSKQICDTMLSQKKNIEFTKDPNNEIQKNGRLIYGAKADKEGQIDFTNNGIQNNLLAIEYISGAGRGCEFYYYDELSDLKNDFAKSKSRDLLLKMQNIDFANSHPNCQGYTRFFKYDNKNYMEYKAYDGHKVMLLEKGSINTVCESSESPQVSVLKTKPKGKILIEEDTKIMDFLDEKTLGY